MSRQFIWSLVAAKLITNKLSQADHLCPRCPSASDKAVQLASIMPMSEQAH